MLDEAKNRHNTISAALDIIDPDGTLVPGTKAHKWVTASLLTWMAEMNPEQVLRKSESAGHMLRLMAHTVP